jgi:23S rRNA (guanosine2251-2'-O)-methyltransferase
MEIVAVLHNVRSVYNVGSVFRTADGAGVSKIYLCGVTPSPLDRFGKVRQDLGKVALGAEEWLPWEKRASTAAVIRKLRKDGYKIFALEQAPGAVPYFKAGSKLPRKIALVAGDEVRGLPSSILAAADKILEIPMYGRKESLNVSVAFGIAAYQLAVQKDMG